MFYTMLCCRVLYSVLCYSIVFCTVMLWRVMLWVMLWYIVLCFVIICAILCSMLCSVLCNTVVCWTMLRYNMLCSVLCYVLVFRAILCVMSVSCQSHLAPDLSSWSWSVSRTYGMMFGQMSLDFKLTLMTLIHIYKQWTATLGSSVTVEELLVIMDTSVADGE